MSVAPVDGNTQSQAAGALSQAAGAGQAMGKDEFLKLLVTQLENQDPLEPMDNTEFVAQLAQFSTLEGITNLQGSVDGMTGSMDSMRDMGTAELIDRMVKTESEDFTFDGTEALAGYELAGPASEVVVTVRNSSGVPVKRINAGSAEGGAYEFVWDGTDDQGVASEPGVYSIDVSAIDDSGAEVGASPFTFSKVTGVEFGPEGPSLMTGSGKISASKIKEIY